MPQNMTSTTTTSSVTAALTDASPKSEITLALMTNLSNNDYLLTKETSISPVGSNNVMEVHTTGEVLLASMECILVSYPQGAWDLTHTLAAMTTHSGWDIPTYADSAVNKHCFVNCSDFSTYHTLSQPDEGQSANKDGQFHIIGHGAVTKTILSGLLRTTITFMHAVHTPDLIANLISISKLNEAKCWALFGGGGVTFYDIREGQKRMLMKGTGNNRMYLLQVEPQIPVTHVLSVHSLKKPTNIEVWHQHFGHASICSITDMAKRGLVNSLDIVEGLELEGKCEDCIYGKQMTQPYDEVVEPETEVRQHVYGDLWGLAHMHSVGGAEYMIVFSDGGSSYCVGYFLTLKSSKATLSTFTEYHVKSERETGRKLVQLRVDMGSEFFNIKWKEYTTNHGITVEFSVPYAHGQNGVAEHGMRTIIEGVHSLLTNSGLPPSLWANAAAFTIYTHPFLGTYEVVQFLELGNLKGTHSNTKPPHTNTKPPHTNTKSPHTNSNSNSKPYHHSKPVTGCLGSFLKNMQIISAGCNTGPLGSIFCGQVLQVFAEILSNQGRLYMKLHPLKISLIRLYPRFF